MLSRSVAFMAAKAINGILHVPINHHPITRYFRQNRRSSNRHRRSVPANDGMLDRAWKIWNRKAIYKQHAGGFGQGTNCPKHSLVGRPQNIDCIDLVDIGQANAISNRAVDDPGVSGIAASRRQLLGVVDPIAIKIQWKDDTCGHHRARQWTTPGLVDTRDARMPICRESLLVLPPIDYRINPIRSNG